MGLRELWVDSHDTTHGMLEHVRKKVKKIGGKRPSANAVKQFFEKVDGDDAWFPGKQYGASRGRKRVLRGPKATAVASSAKTQKTGGCEPTYQSVLATCPDAVLNPATGKPVNKKAVYQVFEERCYDTAADKPWSHQARFSRLALTPLQMENRLAWAVYMQTLSHSPSWYFNAVVWCDLCNSILPRSEQKAQELALSRKGGKGWMSDGSEEQAINLRGNISTRKQNSWNTICVWWVPILSRGKLHVETFGDDFPGETPAGAALMVSRVRAALNVRFPGTGGPKTLFVDRGKGFYHPSTAVITDDFRHALREHGLRAFMGEDAAAQPGALQELMLHETAVAWIRYKLTMTVPTRSWLETPEEYRTRLKGVVAEINHDYRVANLCRELPTRLEQLRVAEGGRLPK